MTTRRRGPGRPDPRADRDAGLREARRRRRLARRRAAVASGAVVLGLAVVAVVAASRHRHQAPPGRATPAPAHAAAPSSAPPSSVAAPPSVRVQDLGALLPRGLQGLAAAPLGGRIYLLGGSGAGGYFSRAIYAFDPATKALRQVAQLPVALHDGGAAAAGGAVFFCGGGQSVGSTAVYRFVPGGAVGPAGALPRPLSDVQGVTVAGQPYCLGGWTGSLYSDQVYRLGASAAAPAAQLPYAVRYGAAAALPGGVLVAGGQRYTGQPTAAVQWVPLPASPGASPAVVGQLPQPLAYAMAAAAPAGPDALVVGGCTASGAPVATIEDVSAQGAVTPVGSLPQPLCYGAAATAGGAVYVFGGQGAGGAPSAEVWEITPSPAGAAAG